MELPFSSPSDIKAFAASLKERLSESTGHYRSTKNAQPATALPAGLKRDLFDALDILLQQAHSDSPSSPPLQRTEPNADLGNQLVDAIDDSLSQWQANISSSFAQSASNEVARQLKQVAQLASELEEQRGRLAEQQSELEKRLADNIRKQALLARQRKTIARDLQARKTRLELERAQGGHTSLTESPSASQQQLQERVARLTEDLRKRDAELEKARAELVHLAPNDSESDLRERLAFAHMELEELAGVAEQLRTATEQLALSQQRCEELEQGCVQDGNSQERIAHLERTVERLEAELQAAQEHASQQQDDSMPALHKLLANTEDQLEDLRRQNIDLAAQVAKQQVVDVGNRPHVSFNQESMSWEERKKLIMQQLESEVEEASFDSQTHNDKRIEIERIMATTQREIDHRDREIAELRAIMEHQCNTSQGVAVGAAAIAQMFESDDLIQQERQKLRDIQAEWEDKLRQAEIDLSLERARLARERNQLEVDIAQLPLRPAEEPEPVETGKKTRKWLEHLGLREEGK